MEKKILWSIIILVEEAVEKFTWQGACEHSIMCLRNNLLCHFSYIQMWQPFSRQWGHTNSSDMYKQQIIFGETRNCKCPTPPPVNVGHAVWTCIRHGQCLLPGPPQHSSKMLPPSLSSSFYPLFFLPLSLLLSFLQSLYTLQKRVFSYCIVQKYWEIHLLF